jgi:hypothetical protein
MCQLVTIGVPKSARPVSTEFGGPRDGLAVTPSRNPHVAKIFPTTDVRLDVTIGGCSCGLIEARHDAPVDHVANQRRRYERLGWSRAKIDGALQASAAAEGRERPNEHARKFRDGVLALLDRVPSLRLFVHMYTGAFDAEAVAAKGAARMTRTEYEAAHGAIPEDTLVEIAG